MIATSDTTTTKRRGGYASKLALLVTVVLVAALVIFVLQNTVHSTINFLGWNFDLGQGVAMLGAAVVGAIIALTATAAFKVRRAVR